MAFISIGHLLESSLKMKKKLSHYKIKPHTTIHLIRRLRGGGREEALYLDPSLREPTTSRI